MKSGYLKLLFAVVSMLVLPQSTLFGIPQSDGEAPVIINPIPAIPPGGPRSIPSLEISASFSVTLSCVYVRLSNVGDLVSVEISNEDTGEYIQTVIPGTYSTVFPISGNEGLWSITFTLESGAMYGGSFII